jgi:hypothetical protein
MRTVEFITALFSEVDEQLRALPKHPEAHLWPSEVVTLGLLHALKGGGNRAFYRWLTRDYRPLFPYGQKIECTNSQDVTGVPLPRLRLVRSRVIWAPPGLPIAKAGPKPCYQRTGMEYAENCGSCVTMVKPSWCAWAMRRRSKGSLWCRGKLSKA